jgi:hypothetical protein
MVKVPEVSEEHSASICRVKQLKNTGLLDENIVLCNM